MVILGIDPGYAIVGYGVVRYDGRGFVPLEYGAVTTEAGLAPEVRLELVYAGILELLDRFHPDAVAIDELFFTNTQKTVSCGRGPRGDPAGGTSAPGAYLRLYAAAGQAGGGGLRQGG